MADGKLIGSGIKAFTSPAGATGTIRFLDSPDEVLDFVDGPDVETTIVISRGGTTTFMSPALMAGVAGLITLQGAPESHLGILSREFGIPCVMSTRFTEGVSTSRGETIPADGTTVRLDIAGDAGQVFLVELSAEMTETAESSTEFDVQKWLQAYLGQVPQGVEGDRQMRARLAVPFTATTDENVRRDRLEPAEINSWLDYAGWNLWDFILGRAAEGESGLIPRQEYETISFVQQWNNYPRFLRLLTDEIGVDGVIELAGTSSREVGTKINVTRNWAASVCPILGRGIGINLEQDTPDSRREDLETLIQFGRRQQHGTWHGGEGFVSGRGFTVPVLRPEVLEPLVAQVRPLDDPAALKAFRQFNARTELFGFMLHYDCRAGMADTGPYPLPGGRFAIVRDHFLNETAYPWSGIAEGLPYCVTEVMVFPGDQVQAMVTEIQTTFTTPSNYLDYLQGAVVFARDRIDTPMGELRVLEAEEMDRITEACRRGTMAMYRGLAKKSTEEKIRDGVMVYTREFLLSHASRVGLWDRFQAEGFDTMTPNAEAAWPVLTSSRAAEILTPVLLFGQGFPHVSD